MKKPVDNRMKRTSKKQVTKDGIVYTVNPSALVAIVRGSETAIYGKLIIPASIEVDDITYPVKGIEYKAFSDYKGIVSVIIPDGVTRIGRGAFEYCSSLTSVTIPNSVTKIGDWAFDETVVITRQCK